MDEDRPRIGEDRVPEARRDAGDDATAGRTPERTTPDAETAYVDLDGEDPGVADDSPPRPPIEPESVDPEHAAFVVVGAALTVAVIAGVV